MREGPLVETQSYATGSWTAKSMAWRMGQAAWQQLEPWLDVIRPSWSHGWIQPGLFSPVLSERGFPHSWTSSTGAQHVAEGREALDPALPYNLRCTGPDRDEWHSCCPERCALAVAEGCLEWHSFFCCGVKIKTCLWEESQLHRFQLL